MSQFWNLVFSGLVTGAIYSIMASGLVLTYTTSGIFNFAHGAVAFATAYLSLFAVPRGPIPTGSPARAFGGRRSSIR